MPTDHDHMQRAERILHAHVVNEVPDVVSRDDALRAIAAALRGQNLPEWARGTSRRRGAVETLLARDWTWRDGVWVEPAQAVPEDPWREAVMSGSLVCAALGEDARSRTSVENVCDVLDAIARVARQLAAAPKPEGR